MADSTSVYEQIETAQAQKEVTANALFDAASPAMIYGRHMEACAGLTWGYYGGRYGGTSIANGTLSLAASSVNYMVVDRATGAVSLAGTSDDEWNDPDNFARAYKITTGASTVTSWEDHRAGANGTQSGGGGSGDPGVAVQVQRKRAVFVDSTYGDDATGAVDDGTKPFATINAALDAAGNSNCGVFLSNARFAPITCDKATPTSPTVNGASKLGSNIAFIGSGRPVLNSATAPTTLVTGSGTIIEGFLVMHSTRHNVSFENLGVDSGSAVSAARYSSTTALDALAWFNVGQIGSQAPALNAQVRNVITLCPTAAGACHSLMFENTLWPVAENCVCIFGTHGFGAKSVGGRFHNIRSAGHATDCFIFKESNQNNDTAPCHDNVASDLHCDQVGSGDTPFGIQLETASTRAMERLSISGVTMRNIATYEVKALTSCTSGTPGLVQKVRIDNLFTDNGTVRTSLASHDAASILINGRRLDQVKGDLIVGISGTADDRLAVGSNGDVLTVDSTTTTGLKWAAPSGGGGGGGTSTAGSPHAFRAYRNTSTQAFTAATQTKVQLNAENFDTDAAFDSTTNYRFQPTIAGYYQFNGSVATSSGAGYVVASLYKNGSQYTNGEQMFPSSSTSPVVTVSDVIYLNGSTDYVELWVIAAGSSPSVSTGSAYTFLSGALLAVSASGLPVNAQSANYTALITDANSCLSHPSSDTTARTFTIPSNASVPFPIGTVLEFDNEYGAGALSIAITTDTLELVGAAGSTGTRTLATGGNARAVKKTATKWRIQGVYGLS